MTGQLFGALAEAVLDHPEATIGTLTERTSGVDLLEQSMHRRDRLNGALAVQDAAPARVAIIRRNSPGYVSDLLSVLSAGHVPFLMDPSLGAGELAKLFDDCGIDAVFHDESANLSPEFPVLDCAGSMLALLGRSANARPLHSTTEVCRLTSGSTRTPGCIEFSGTAVLASARGWHAASGVSDADTILCFAGLYNGLGFNAALVPGMLAGANLCLPSGLPAASNVRRHIAELDPTVLVAFPAAYDALAASGNDTLAQHRLRLALSSAARLKAETSAALAQHGIRIADYYGIAETGPLTFNAEPVPGGGQGFPLPGVSLVIDEQTGTLLAKSRSMGTRYLNYPGMLEERITETGHYRTSDQGSLTGRGELLLGERADTSFSAGGKKFTAEEVEDLLLTHPDIASCAVAMFSPNTGGRSFLGAVVVGRKDIDVVAIRRFCLDHAAAFKVPERIVEVTEIPRNGAGKTQRAAVAQLLAAGLNQPTVKG